MLYLLPIAVPVITLVMVSRYLSGENLAKYDEDIPVTFEGNPKSKGQKFVLEYLDKNFTRPAQSGGEKSSIAAKRARFEENNKTRKFPSRFTPLQIGNMDGEWVRAKKADPDKRILYIHGGGNTVGSALSHRAITSKLAELTGASVCAINYRLMPENSRKAGIEDCRQAYKWILDNGPEGPATVKKLAVAGDSAGGNLTLSLINWVRDNSLRPADAVVALSPMTDSTGSSPSMRANVESDIMLKPLVAPLLKLPRPVLLLGIWKSTSFAPSAPEISPIYADLSNLPPILIQASSAEMLYDDARRYTVKARRAGTDVQLQTWSHMCHVWQAFEQHLKEANDALKEIAKFLKAKGF